MAMFYGSDLKEECFKELFSDKVGLQTAQGDLSAQVEGFVECFLANFALKL